MGSYEEYVKRFEELDCKVLSTKEEYEAGAEKYKFKFRILAQCKHERVVDYYYFAKSCFFGCLDCNKKKAIENKRIPYEEIKKKFEDVGAKLMTTMEEYKSMKGQLVKVWFSIIPKCGHECKVLFYNFMERSDQNCQTCNKAMGAKKSGESNRTSYDEVKRLFEDLGVELLTTKEDFENNYMRIGHEYFLIRAKCGHECEKRYGDLKISPTKKCGECARFDKDNGNLSYEEIAKRFEDVGCKLLTTKEEYVQKKMTTYSELVFKTFCDHERTIRLSHTKLTDHMLCKECLYENQSVFRKEIAKEDGLLSTQIMEYESICFVKNYLEENFYFEVLDECCRADVAIKPKDVTEDLWIGIQLKSTETSKKVAGTNYSFSTDKNDYEGMVLLCVCVRDKKVWNIDLVLTKDLSGVRIVDKPGTKYFDFKVNLTNLHTNIKDEYDKLPKKCFADINYPLIKTHQQEQEFKKYRIAKIDFLTFEKPYMNCLVYDFKINGRKVQEKVAGEDYKVSLHKSAGNKKKQPYENGDNDYYWINLKDKRYFYIIPEKELIDQGFLKTDTQPGKTGMYLQPSPYFKSGQKNQWVHKYMYDYDNLDKDRIKSLFRI